MSAWLFTILRSLFRSEYRKRRREVEDPEDSYFASLTTPPGAVRPPGIQGAFAALAKLRHAQCEAVVLVGASGFTFDDATGVAVGTIKSRVNRARRGLAELLVIDSAGKLSPNPTTTELRAD